MPSGGRELFPPDRGLQIRMALALVLGVLALAATLGLFVAVSWRIVQDDPKGGPWVVFFLVGIGLVGAFEVQQHVSASSESDRIRALAAQDRLEAVVDRLAMIAGLRVPGVAIDARQAPLCWTQTWLGGGHTVFATIGLVETLSNDELTAVVAHELAHVANGDARLMTVMGGPSTSLLNGIRSIWENPGYNPRRWVALIAATVLLVPIALPGWLAARMLSRYRELAADRGAVAITGSPATLISALMRLSGGIARTPNEDLRAVASSDLFYVLPTHGDARGIQRLWATHPPLERRLQQLEEMERNLHAARPVLDPA